MDKCTFLFLLLPVFGGLVVPGACVEDAGVRAVITKGSGNGIRMHETTTITIELTAPGPLTGQFDVNCDNHFIDICRAEFEDQGQTALLTFTEKEKVQTVNVLVTGNIIGFTNLSMFFDGQLINGTRVAVVMTATDEFLATVFGWALKFFVAFANALMGTQLSFAILKDIIKKPVGPAVGFCCQFCIMPFVAFGLAKLMFPLWAYGNDPLLVKLLQFSMFVCGCCPGGGKSSFWTIIFNGNINLSVAMTFTQTIGAAFMMPLLLFTLGRTFFDDEIKIPFLSLVEVLALLVLPAIAGMIFIHYFDHLIKKMRTVLKTFSWFLTLAITISALYIYRGCFYYFSWRLVFCICVHPWIGYVAAYLVPWLLKLEHTDRMTIAFETGIQNIGIAYLLCLDSLPISLFIVTIAIPTGLLISTDKPLIIIWLARKAYRKWFSTEKNTTTTDKESQQISLTTTILACDKI